MRHRIARGLGLCGALWLSVAAAVPLLGQDPREALVARAFNEFDVARRQHLLMSALNPAAGPPSGVWPVGVQLLAQTLIEDAQDSVAAVWLRWAIRLSPDLRPDTVQFLPRVVAAVRSARTFVSLTGPPEDSGAVTSWQWPAQETGESMGTLRARAAGLVPVQVEVKGVGPIALGGTIPLNPGSYEISASASGYDSLRATREVLPGITTSLELHLRSTLTRVRSAEPRLSLAPPPHQGGISWWVKVGAGGGVLWAILWNAYIKSH
jgi:hypothetical protein